MIGFFFHIMYIRLTAVIWESDSICISACNTAAALFLLLHNSFSIVPNQDHMNHNINYLKNTDPDN